LEFERLNTSLAGTNASISQDAAGISVPSAAMFQSQLFEHSHIFIHIFIARFHRPIEIYELTTVFLDKS
jgi:hypothetical protein